MQPGAAGIGSFESLHWAMAFTTHMRLSVFIGVDCSDEMYYLYREISENHDIYTRP